MLANYLFLQPLIEARLKAEVAGGMPVEGIEELAQAGKEDQRPFVIFVYWAGDRFDETEAGRAGRGTSQMMRQRWFVILYARNAAQANRDARNASVGALLTQLHKALAGWQPEGCARTFTRCNGLVPDYTRASGLYPLAFEITLTL